MRHSLRWEFSGSSDCRTSSDNKRWFSPPTSSSFTQYPLNYYHIDIALPSAGTFDFQTQASNLAYSMINTGLNGVWDVYVYGADIVIRVVQWAFNLQIVQDMLSSVTFAIQAMDHSLWEPLWYFGTAVSFGGAVYLWLSRKTTKMWQTLITSGCVVGLAGTIFMQTPQTLTQINQASADASTSILTHMSAAVPGTNGNALDTVSKALWNDLVNEPYLLIEFGSTNPPQQDVNAVMKLGTDYNSRGQWFENNHKQYPIATPDGIGQRMGYMFFVDLCGLIMMVGLVAFGASDVWWQFVALARAILGLHLS